jgi:magnesium-transporting ATPase (P-type)
LAVEHAHIGVGLGGAEAKRAMRVANVVLLKDSIGGIQECIAQGRAVFFAMSSLIQGYIYSSSILFLLTVYSALTKRTPQLMSLPSLIVLSMMLNQLSHFTLKLLNDKIKAKVMRQGPFTKYDSLFRKT